MIIKWESMDKHPAPSSYAPYYSIEVLIRFRNVFDRVAYTVGRWDFITYKWIVSEAVSGDFLAWSYLDASDETIQLDISKPVKFDGIRYS